MRVQAPASSVLIQRQQDFASVISRDDPGAEASARRAAEDFTSIAFVEPLLKQLRESNDAATPFAPGPGERQFGDILDQIMARQLTRASRFPLVDRLEADLSRANRHSTTEARA